MSTIKDVAKLANVSISTVSRVINNVPNVNSELKSRVLIAIKELNYEPNKMAQSLSGSPFKSIGIASTRSSNSEYTSQILSSIGEVMSEKNYNIILNHSKDTTDEVNQCISIVKGCLAQGLILIGSKCKDKLIEELYKINVPFIVIGKIYNKEISKFIYHIDTDNFTDCKEAVQYLFSLGHVKVGCIHSDLSYTVNMERLNGYMEAFNQAKIEIYQPFIVNGGFTVVEAIKAGVKILSQPHRPTAIFATDDIKAMGCYKAAFQLGLRIPEDISIVGHNNYDISQIAIPSLSTIDVPVKQLGTQAAHILYNIINGIDAPVETILPTKFVTRNSCSYIK
ncbi:MAG: hypothetical protein ATN32_09580 [Candidatus Epulonipiscium fishelsonii]|nr:MAG: hypothetical protein ATN32_09580 [Epulopiscium sp. AS2M-Bin002]